jgi:hypothetical protein
MNTRKILLVTLLLSLPILTRAQNYDHSAGGCGPKKTQFDVKTTKVQPPAPKPGDRAALVYVIEWMWLEPGINIDGAKPTTRVGVDGSWVGANHGDSYFFFPIDAGNHSICTDWQSAFYARSGLASAADLVADAGGVYYFRVKVRDADHDRPGEVKIEQIDAAEGRLLVAASEFATSHQKK